MEQFLSSHMIILYLLLAMVVPLLLGFFVGFRARKEGPVSQVSVAGDSPLPSAISSLSAPGLRPARYEFLREHGGEFVPTGEFFAEGDLDPHSAVLLRAQQEGVAFALRKVED